MKMAGKPRQCWSFSSRFLETRFPLGLLVEGWSAPREFNCPAHLCFDKLGTNGGF